MKKLHVFKFATSTQRADVCIVGIDVPEQSAANIELLDHLGRLRHAQSFQLEAGEQELTCKFPPLKPGLYHAWISVGGHTVIRELHVKEGKRSFSFRQFFG